tara:strand:- start:901 stop:1128 length:228 start_codon:yes stop_codon:yes gene_type:complete
MIKITYDELESINKDRQKEIDRLNSRIKDLSSLAEMLGRKRCGSIVYGELRRINYDKQIEINKLNDRINELLKKE